MTHGCAHVIGSIEQHKMADLVLWQPMFFGVKPEIIIKGGQVSWSQGGLGVYADVRPEPICLRKKFGAVGRSPNANSVVFVSKVKSLSRSLTDYSKRKPCLGLCRAECIEFLRNM